MSEFFCMSICSFVPGSILGDSLANGNSELEEDLINHKNCTKLLSAI